MCPNIACVCCQLCSVYMYMCMYVSVYMYMSMHVCEDRVQEAESVLNVSQHCTCALLALLFVYASCICVPFFVCLHIAYQYFLSCT